MSVQPNQPIPSIPEPAEPKVGRAPAPVWLFILALVLIYWGMVYFDERSGWFNEEVYQPFRSYAHVDECQPPKGFDPMRGKAQFDLICALCHNAAGTGNPNQAPPFVGSEWVTGSPNRMIQIPLTGLTGPIQVAGKEMTFPSAMPAMGASLSDDDLAAVLTYIRYAFGNKAPAITPDQVKAVRAKVGNHTQPSTPTELNSIP